MIVFVVRFILMNDSYFSKRNSKYTSIAGGGGRIDKSFSCSFPESDFFELACEFSLLFFLSKLWFAVSWEDHQGQLLLLQGFHSCLIFIILGGWGRKEEGGRDAQELKTPCRKCAISGFSRKQNKPLCGSMTTTCLCIKNGCSLSSEVESFRVRTDLCIHCHGDIYVKAAEQQLLPGNAACILWTVCLFPSLLTLAWEHLSWLNWLLMTLFWESPFSWSNLTFPQSIHLHPNTLEDLSQRKTLTWMDGTVVVWPDLCLGLRSCKPISVEHDNEAASPSCAAFA